MKIKTRLALQFTLIVSTIIIVSSSLIYYFSFTSQRSKFRENLLNRAKNTAVLLINVEEVDSTLLKKIHQSTISWKYEEILLTDSAFNVLYSNDLSLLKAEKLRNVDFYEPYSFFKIGNKDAVCFRHHLGNRSFNVFVAAIDIGRLENLKSLRSILFWTILFSIWLSVYASYLFSQKAIKPISDIVRSIREINSSRLNTRLDEGKGKDEIELLAITFNEMLSNIETAFRAQEEFVSNASHELRTPLAVMISEGDYLVSGNRDPQELMMGLLKILDDLRSLNTRTNSLLELAHLNRDNIISTTKVRIDEILFSAISGIKPKYPGRKIISKVDYPENEKDLEMQGNPGLLEIAFRNLIDNACKFSDDDVNITILNTDQLLVISVADNGIGIPFDEVNLVNQPFRRGANAKYISGFGIGLSVVSRIVELHNGKLELISNQNKGTRAEISFWKKKKLSE